MKYNMQITECPECGSKEIRKGYQVQTGSIMKRKIGLIGCSVEHIFCGECGIILKSKVTRPEMFLN